MKKPVCSNDGMVARVIKLLQLGEHQKLIESGSEESEWFYSQWFHVPMKLHCLSCKAFHSNFFYFCSVMYKCFMMSTMTLLPERR